MKKTLIFSVAIVWLMAIPVAAQQTGEPSTAVPDYSQYILTPKASAAPRINGAKIFGARPKSPFLFTIAASGERPMHFGAESLPRGLKLDAQTGVITGSIAKEGTYDVVITASNRAGAYSRKLRIVIGEQLALTPPMEWNSWNCWGNSVSQEKVSQSARAMVESGLRDHGWSYINIDDGWQGVRGGKFGAIQPNCKFPHMKELADSIHTMGLKLGIYSSPWVGTYAGHAGSYADDADGSYEWVRDGKYNENYKIDTRDPDDPRSRNERAKYYRLGKYSFVENDARQWAEWGIDYLKYDWFPNDYYHVKEMRDALRAQRRDIVYSLSNGARLGDAPSWKTMAECWRTTGDIVDTWESMSRIGLSQDRWIAFSGPGHWPDPDMLVVGMVGWGPNLHYTRLTPDEQYFHISLWAMLAAPMLIGCDMSQLDDFTLNLLCNDEVNDVNQDILGIHAALYYSDKNYVTYVKQLDDGSVAVGMFNLSDSTRKIGFVPRSIGLHGRQKIRDLWRQCDVAEINGRERYDADVPAHGVVMVRVYPGNSRQK